MLSSGHSPSLSSRASSPSLSSRSPSRRSRHVLERHLAKQSGILHVQLHSASGLPAADGDASGSADPYMSLSIGSRPKPKMSAKRMRTLDPQYEETFTFHGDFDDLCRGPLICNAYHDAEGGNYQRLGQGSADLKLYPLVIGQCTPISCVLKGRAATQAEAAAVAVHMTLRWEHTPPLQPHSGIVHAHISQIRMPASPPPPSVTHFVELALGDQTLCSERFASSEG